MKTPMVLSDMGDILVFQSVSDLERAVESPDASSCQVFDASGRRYYFRGHEPGREPERPRRFMEWIDVVPVTLDLDNPGEVEVDNLKKQLGDFLVRIGVKESFEGWTLEQLLERVIERAGYSTW